MKLRKILFLLGIIFFVSIICVYFYKIRHPEIFSGSDSGPAFTKITAGRQAQNGISYAKVKEVVDGDTIKLESGETVRYIGINSPEVYEYDSQTKKWDKIYKCYSGEAMRKNKELVEGKIVRLEKDISEKDKFGRLLRNVWVDSCHPESADSAGEGSRDSSPSAQNDKGLVQKDDNCKDSDFINLKLVFGGFAKTMTVLPDRKYEQQILAAEKEARENKRGLWSTCR